MGVRYVQKPLPGEVVDWEVYCGAYPQGAWFMHEGSGLYCYDASGNNNHGTLTNGPVWTPTQYGTGLRFNGTTTRVNISAVQDDWDFAKGTLLWIGSCDVTQASSYPQLFSVGTGVTDYFEGWIEYGQIRFRCGNGTTGFACTGGYAGGTYTNWAFVWDNTVGAWVYRAALLAGSNIGTWDAPVKTGWSLNLANRYNEAQYLLGTITATVIWPVALTAAQVAALQGPIPIWVPTYYSIAAAGGSVFPLPLFLASRRRSVA